MLQCNIWTQKQVLQLLNMEELEFKNCQFYSAFNDLIFSFYLIWNSYSLTCQPGCLSDFSFYIVWISNGHSCLLCHHTCMLLHANLVSWTFTQVRWSGMLKQLRRSSETAVCVTTVLSEYQFGNLKKCTRYSQKPTGCKQNGFIILTKIL